ncbi:hypothetical protein POVWA2_022540 [Plasmodium ovale wallikeri]|uniref:Uncharacterized protein n=1 Tax=Plasmodium ovale wallikeri TaxID=864142 RepID=A0A1A8YTW5_PLAOA|nr:hypothetical protein POVWA2_022540 [Plasmodium ovale wallikeri]
MGRSTLWGETPCGEEHPMGRNPLWGGAPYGEKPPVGRCPLLEGCNKNTKMDTSRGGGKGWENVQQGANALVQSSLTCVYFYCAHERTYICAHVCRCTFAWEAGTDTYPYAHEMEKT